jgi:hypothetical protein
VVIYSYNPSWNMPVIQATQEAKAGRSQVQVKLAARSRLKNKIKMKELRMQLKW